MTITEQTIPETRIPYQEELNKEAKFTLYDQLKDPVSFDSRVVSMEESESLSEFPNVRIINIGVADPFIEADPVTHEHVRSYIEDVIEPMVRREGLGVLGGMTRRTEATSRNELNPVSKAWLADPRVEPLLAWRENVPSALALSALTDPVIGKPVVSKETGDVLYATPETVAQWRFVKDAIAIRARAAGMTEIAEGFLESNLELLKYIYPEGVNWLSLASGTAEPSIKAAKVSAEKSGVNIDLTVADWDGRSLSFVEENAQKTGFTGKITTMRQNILSPNLKDKLMSKTGRGQFQVVENLGFEEYLPEEGDTMGAFKSQGLPAASEFTRNAFDLVAPGGILISGNMVLPRKQADFVFGAVDWPLINARTEQEILNVYKRAGVFDSPAATTTMYRIIGISDQSHLYNIVSVEKKFNQ